jgi:hypothetical protein
MKILVLYGGHNLSPVLQSTIAVVNDNAPVGLCL